jgi:hypothetical protein
MRKLPCLATADKLRERVIFIDMLKQQMLDLEALCEEVAEAERRSKVREDSQLPASAHLRPHAPRTCPHLKKLSA